MTSTSFGSGFRTINTPYGAQMKDRRLLKCNGKCGRAKCRYETVRRHHLKRHIRRIVKKPKKKVCPHCGIKTKRVDKHIKRKHPEKYVRKIHPCPFPDDPHGWTFVKHLVSVNDGTDRRLMHRWSKQDREELLARDNNIRHEIAIKVYNRWKSMGEYDDAGGYIKGGLHLRMFSLHKLSPDRINNKRPHFIGNDLRNLNFVSSGMNTPCNIVSTHGKKTCVFLRERSKIPITETEIQTILERERNKTAKYDGKTKANKVYNSCNTAWRKDGHLYFKSMDDMFIYVYDLLVKQRAICNTSDFLIDQHAGTKSIKGSTNPFQPSLNAKIPRLGHRPGNLEWVCAFVNSQDLDKKNDIADGVPTGWVKPSFKSYIGI
jgi:hypothetical protein